MVKVKILVNVAEGETEKYEAYVYTYDPVVKQWVLEDKVMDIGGANTWSDVGELVDSINPDGIVA